MPLTPTEGRVRLIVCGSRTFLDRTLLYAKLDALASNLTNPVIVVGDAAGTDALAEDWAYSRKLTVTKFRADWEKGKSAGPIRNAEMIEFAMQRQPAFCVAFWDGESPGTKDIVARCKKAKIETRVVLFKEKACRKVSTTSTGQKRSTK